MPLHPIHHSTDLITFEELQKRISEEGFVSGTVTLHCDIEFFIIGEKQRRHEFLSRSFFINQQQELNLGGSIQELPEIVDKEHESNANQVKK